MDPDTVWRSIRVTQEGEADSDLAWAALDLLVWIAGGGFVPRTAPRHVVVERCKQILTYTLDLALEEGA